MSAIILFAFSILVLVASLLLPVSADKLAFELGALALFATAAYCRHCFDVRQLPPDGAATDEQVEERKKLQQIVVVFGGTAAACFLMFGLTSMSMSGKPSTPGSTTEPNTLHALVIAYGIYFAVLALAIWRWAEDTRCEPRVARSRMVTMVLLVVCIVAMVGRTAYLAPRLPAFHLGDGEGL